MSSIPPSAVESLQTAAQETIRALDAPRPGLQSALQELVQNHSHEGIIAINHIGDDTSDLLRLRRMQETYTATLEAIRALYAVAEYGVVEKSVVRPLLNWQPDDTVPAEITKAITTFRQAYAHRLKAMPEVQPELPGKEGTEKDGATGNVPQAHSNGKRPSSKRQPVQPGRR